MYNTEKDSPLCSSETECSWIEVGWCLKGNDKCSKNTEYVVKILKSEFSKKTTTTTMFFVIEREQMRQNETEWDRMLLKFTSTIVDGVRSPSYAKRLCFFFHCVVRRSLRRKRKRVNSVQKKSGKNLCKIDASHSIDHRLITDARKSIETMRNERWIGFEVAVCALFYTHPSQSLLIH